MRIIFFIIYLCIYKEYKFDISLLLKKSTYLDTYTFSIYELDIYKNLVPNKITQYNYIIGNVLNIISERKKREREK